METRRVLPGVFLRFSGGRERVSKINSTSRKVVKDFRVVKCCEGWMVGLKRTRMYCGGGLPGNDVGTNMTHPLRAASCVNMQIQIVNELTSYRSAVTQASVALKWRRHRYCCGIDWDFWRESGNLRIIPRWQPSTRGFNKIKRSNLQPVKFLC